MRGLVCSLGPAPRLCCLLDEGEGAARVLLLCGHPALGGVKPHPAEAPTGTNLEVLKHFLLCSELSICCFQCSINLGRGWLRVWPQNSK